MDSATWALVAAVFVACIVESVEATTIVMAMGFTRGWRSALTGVAIGLAALVVFTWLAGYALTTWLPEAALQLIIGTLLLVFGLQWLRKAIYRASGRKGLHDEEAIYQREVAAAQEAGAPREGLDSFGVVVSLKATFLEGVEVVFIVLTFGLQAHHMLAASLAAVAAALVVLVVAVLVRRPLSMIPENTLKYGVGLLLTSFGLFWSLEGMGITRPSRESLAFFGSDLAILYWLVVVTVLSQVLIRLFRPRRTAQEAIA